MLYWLFLRFYAVNQADLWHVAYIGMTAPCFVLTVNIENFSSEMAAVCSLLSLFLISSKAGTINCFNSCSVASLICQDGEDCNVICSGYPSCSTRTIICPQSSHKCNVRCDISIGTGSACNNLKIGKYSWSYLSIKVWFIQRRIFHCTLYFKEKPPNIALFTYICIHHIR